MSVGDWNSGAIACKSKNARGVISARWHPLLSLRMEEALCSPEPVQKASWGSLREPLTCLALGRGMGTKRSKQRQSCHLSSWSCPEFALVLKIPSQRKEGVVSKGNGRRAI